MYIDIILLIVLIVLVIIFFNRFSSFVFLMAMIEIFLRLLTFLKNNIGLKDVSAVIDKYIPESIFEMINKYTGNMPTINTILKWAFAIIMTIFLSYIFKIFMKKKKI